MNKLTRLMHRPSTNNKDPLPSWLDTQRTTVDKRDINDLIHDTDILADVLNLQLLELNLGKTFQSVLITGLAAIYVGHDVISDYVGGSPLLISLALTLSLVATISYYRKKQRSPEIAATFH